MFVALQRGLAQRLLHIRQESLSSGRFRRMAYQLMLCGEEVDAAPSYKSLRLHSMARLRGFQEYKEEMPALSFVFQNTHTHTHPTSINSQRMCSAFTHDTHPSPLLQF